MNFFDKKNLFYIILIAFIFFPYKAYANSLCPFSNSKNEKIATMSLLGCVENPNFSDNFNQEKQAELLFEVGKKYYKGEGDLKKSAKYASKFFRRSAKLDYGKAQEALGLLYLKGEGVSQNSLNAYIWLGLASKKGLKKATSALNTAKKILNEEQISYAKEKIKKWLEENSK
jgi:TPR repeat protein